MKLTEIFDPSEDLCRKVCDRMDDADLAKIMHAIMDCLTNVDLVDYEKRFLKIEPGSTQKARTREGGGFIDPEDLSHEKLVDACVDSFEELARPERQRLIRLRNVRNQVAGFFIIAPFYGKHGWKVKAQRALIDNDLEDEFSLDGL